MITIMAVRFTRTKSVLKSRYDSMKKLSVDNITIVRVHRRYTFEPSRPCVFSIDRETIVITI